MSIHPQDVRALLGHEPEGHPVSDEQLRRIVAVLNDARSEPLAKGAREKEPRTRTSGASHP